MSEVKDNERISSLDPHTRGYKETGVYTYKTDKAVESFGTVPYSPPIQPKSDLSPSSVYVEPSGSLQAEKEREFKKFCKANPTNPKCFRGSQNQTMATSDESNPYQELGIFSEEVKDIFTPEGRDRILKKNTTDTDIQNMYESTRDNVQLTQSPVVRTECQCKDGRVVLGYLDTRSGSKDCSPCNTKSYTTSTPNAYKNYQTKKKKVWQDRKVPLRKQTGVSTFGDVNMKGCQTGGSDYKKIEKIDSQKNLNQILSTKQSRGVKTNPNTPQSVNPSQSAFSIYDDCNVDIYGIGK